MKPAWDELMELYKDSPSYLIADVDCTAEGKPLCTANGVRGYPTILWGDPGDLTKYQGKRTLEDLKSHVEKNMKPLCSPFNPSVCDDEQTAAMKKYQAMDSAALDTLLGSTKKELSDETKAHKKVVADAEAAFKAIKDEKSAAISIMKSVQAFAAKDAKDEL